MLFFHARDIIAHNDDPLVLLHAAEVDNAIDFGNLSGIFGPSRFKELGNTRQTARDILRLDRAARQFRQQRTRLRHIGLLGRRSQRSTESHRFRRDLQKFESA